MLLQYAKRAPRMRLQRLSDVRPSGVGIGARRGRSGGCANVDGQAGGLCCSPRRERQPLSTPSGVGIGARRGRLGERTVVFRLYKSSASPGRTGRVMLRRRDGLRAPRADGRLRRFSLRRGHGWVVRGAQRCACRGSGVILKLATGGGNRPKRSGVGIGSRRNRSGGWPRGPLGLLVGVPACYSSTGGARDGGRVRRRAVLAIDCFDRRILLGRSA